ncbi:MAG: galactose-1-phosphate uridylyltransferase [Planctomycetota bacterium]|nr:galactose-1-phosphate uridylyltransferase [Planctomycetota bacterium]
MSELRKDPILGDWVILAPGRASRPFDTGNNRSGESSEVCPFCKGNENETPAAVMTISDDDADDWAVRVIPNRYSAVTSFDTAGSDAGTSEQTAGSIPAPGYHEVFVESPTHHQAMRELSESQVSLILQAWRDRLAKVSEDPAVAHTMIFRNEGAAAGASLEHVHSQLLATSFVPARIGAELDAGRTHYELTGQLAWTAMLERELFDRRRIITESEHFVLLCPFASRFPGEMCLLPHVSSPGFETTSDEDLKLLTAVLRKAIVKLDRVFQGAAFNLGLHTAPPRDPGRPYYHWHMTITPRLTGIAGFEVGSGAWINIVSPEDAANRYRTSSS